MKKIILFLVVIFSSFGWMSAWAEDSSDKSTDEKKTKVVIYPILINAPLFGASIDLPALPDNGGGGGGNDGGEIQAETDSSLNGAVFAGASVINPRWFVDFDGLWAGLTAERKGQIFSKVRTDAFYFNLIGGWHIAHDVSLTAGVRHMGLKIHAQVEDVLDKTVKPGIWDPLVGIDWRRNVKPKLYVNAAFQGGGFGVGSDVDVSGLVRVDWKVAKHFVLDAGYNFMYYKITVANVQVGPFEREFVTKQTLSGPRFGLGILF